MNHDLSSASFKIISTFSFPEVASQYVTQNLRIYQSPNHDPVVLFTSPNSAIISLFNVIYLQPRKPPSFPYDDERDGLAETARQLRLDDPRGSSRVELSPTIFRWEMRTVPADISSQPQHTSDEHENLLACAMGMGGRTVLAVGVKGSIWVWNKTSERGNVEK